MIAKKRRGLTMVMALFVTFLLSTLSLAFVMLMMEDSRGSRSSAWQVMAAEGAEWGIETTLSYMGRGGNWQPAFDPDRLVFFDLLNPGQPNGSQHLVASAGGQGGIEIRVEAGSEEESASRILRIVNPELAHGAALNLDGRLLGRVTVEVKPVDAPLAAYGPGQAAQYSVTCLCELFPADAQGDVVDPVAVPALVPARARYRGVLNPIVVSEEEEHDDLRLSDGARPNLIAQLRAEASLMEDPRSPLLLL